MKSVAINFLKLFTFGNQEYLERYMKYKRLRGEIVSPFNLGSFHFRSTLPLSITEMGFRPLSIFHFHRIRDIILEDGDIKRGKIKTSL